MQNNLSDCLLNLKFLLNFITNSLFSNLFQSINSFLPILSMNCLGLSHHKWTKLCSFLDLTSLSLFDYPPSISRMLITKSKMLYIKLKTWANSIFIKYSTGKIKVLARQISFTKCLFHFLCFPLNYLASENNP